MLLASEDRSRSRFRTEAEFHLHLARLLESKFPFCRVWLHEGRWPRKFHVRGVRSYPDLYVMTDRSWKYHLDYPSFAVEAKLPQLGWLIESLEQVQRYDDLRTVARYDAGPKPLPAPRMVLLATPESIGEGILYDWEAPPEVVDMTYDEFSRAAARDGAVRGLTYTFERLLWRHGGALLKGPELRFQPNGNSSYVYFV